MTAKEYFEKYDTPVMRGIDDGQHNAVLNLLSDLLDEAEKTNNRRGNTKSIETTVAVLKEMNQRWNGVRNLYIKKYGSAHLIKDGFLIFCVRKVPQLKLYLPGYKF